MQIWLLSALLASVVVLIVGLLAMLLLRFRGRPIPTWLIRLVVVVLALQSGLGGIVCIRTPFVLASIALQTAVIVWFLWRAGRRTTTGILLIGTGALGALWWGQFLARDLLDPVSLYEPVLWLWWAPSAILLVVGAALIPLGDRTVDRPLFPQASSLSRDPMPLGTAITRELSIGPIPVATVVADGLALIAAIIVISLLTDRVPWPVTWIAASAVYAVIGTELFFYAIPRRLRRAWAGTAIVGSPEMKRWQRETGTPVPVTAAKMRAWLDKGPDRPDIRWARAELQATLGELEAARESVRGMALKTDIDRFDQRALLAWIDWLGGADEHLDELQALAEQVGLPGSDERAEALAKVALARARQLATDGGNWKEPLERLTRERGSLGEGLLQGDLRRARYRVEPLLGLFLTGGLILLSQLGR